MKIFHYRNLSNAARYYANAQKRLGHEAVVTNSVNDGFEYDFFIKKNLSTVRKILLSYDLYHIHSGVFVYHGLEAIAARLRGKKIFYHHWGSDIRRGRRHYWDPDKPKPPWLQNLGIHILQNADLLDYMPDEIFIHSPIDLEKWPRAPPKPSSEIVRILHSPLYEKGGDVNFEVKGTKYVIEAVEELKKEYKIEWVIARNMPHKEMINLHRHADIVIDQLIVPWYGMTTMEAMSQARPVCTYVREDLLQYTMNPTPLMNSTPKTIKDNLRYLIENEDERRRLGELGRKYIEEHHDADKVTRELMKLVET